MTRPAVPVPTWRLAAITLLLVSAALAQEPAPAEATPTPPGGPRQVEIRDVLAQFDRAPAGLRLGARAHVMRESQFVADRVVIVESADAAAEAIRGWRGLLRYPVLIDDGSVLASENIARFVRAFRPAAVIRWDPETDWPGDAGARASRIARVLGESLDAEAGLETMRQVVDRMRERGVGPQGVVVLDPEDPAWVAGLAVAVARVQPIVFLRSGRRVNAAMTGDEMRAMAEAIQTQMQQVGLRWSEAGDEIDAVTIAANVALRVGLGEDGKDEKALTDLIGRHRFGIGARWAWAGNIFGDSQTALYRAMCGLFLPVSSAWLFDGYGQGDPWDLYDATAAARAFDGTTIRAEIFDTPNNRLEDWRRACAPGIDTDLVLVNSKGTVGAFQILSLDATSGDIPLLDRPAMMHIVHSWSARVPGSPASVAGRWLEHGVYAYYGSIDEPYLSAFVPTPLVANRLLAGLPFGVAVRTDDGPPWKLNLLGDPLVTVQSGATCGRRIDRDIALSPVENLRDVSSAAIKAGDFATGLGLLVLQGRDADAARLARALLAEKPEAFGNAAARASLMALYREGAYDAFAAAYNALSPEDQKTLLFQDALWHAARVVLEAGPSTPMEGLLRRNLRAGQPHKDAVEAADHIARRAGAAQAVAFLEGVMPEITNDRQRQEVASAIRRFGGGSRP